MALTTLCTLPSHDLRQWNTVIKRKLLEGNFGQAITTYVQVQELGFLGDNYTFPILLKAASALSSLSLGSLLHGQAIKTGFLDHGFVQTALINMYSTLGDVVNARRVFETMPRRDVVAWNSILHAYTSWGQMDLATQLFDSMPLKDQVSFNIMASGYADAGRMDCAEKVFHKTPSRDTFSWNSMISAYVRAGKLDFARTLFDRMPERNVVSWNTIIAGYLQSECFVEVIDLFYEMKAQGIEPSHLTLVTVLSACANLGSLEMGVQIHMHGLVTGLASSLHVATALIDMYAKCGSIERSLQVFYKTPNKDIYCWNSAISGLASHGYGEASIKLFEDMRNKGVKPDDITFIGLVSACSHAGLVSEGFHLFESMEKEFGLSPKSEHYGCVVDLLGRAGHLDRAYGVVERMPFEPGVTVLGALLSACMIHGNVEMGEVVALRIAARADYRSDGEYMMLVNMYARCGRWEEAKKWRGLMNGKGVTKTAGCSMIEVGGRVYRFLAGDIGLQ